MFCPKCGTAALSSTQKFCTKCGTSLGGTGAATAAAAAPTGLSEEDSPYAGFWARVAALVIDWLLINFALYLVFGIGSRAAKIQPASAVLVIFLAAVFVPWLYYAIMESSGSQGTLGKLALGIKVTDLRGEQVSFMRATGRYFARLVSFVTFGIGFLTAAFTKRRQALHDVIADTLVVQRRYDPDYIAEAGPAPQVSAAVIVLAVLGFVLFGPFGLGIMAAIAIPAYQDFTIRSQIVEGLNAANPYKAAVANAAAEGQALRTLTTEKLQLPVVGQWKYVDSIKVVQGVVVINYGHLANQAIAGKAVLVAPATVGEGQSIVWYCGHHSVPAGATPVTNRDLSSYTTVPNRYLPTLCRQGY